MKRLIDGHSRPVVISITTLSFIFYLLGLFTPLYTSTHFYIFSKESTLFQSILLLFNHREIYLGALIFIFTIFLPIIEFVVVFIKLFKMGKTISKKYVKFLTLLSKWSMLDVFVVAVILINLKFDSRIIDMKLGQGIIWFSLSVILLLISLAYLGNPFSTEKEEGTYLLDDIKEK
jgi:paraquat-inducible protein A